MKVKVEDSGAVQRRARAEPVKPLIQGIEGKSPEAGVQGMSICNDQYGYAASSQHFLTNDLKNFGQSEIESSVGKKLELRRDAAHATNAPQASVVAPTEDSNLIAHVQQPTWRVGQPLRP